MSETVVVFAGNEGDQIPVAGRTDGDGNKVQLVDVLSAENLNVYIQGQDTALRIRNDEQSCVATLAVDNDNANVTQAEDIMIQIVGDSNGDFVPEITLDDANWVQVAISLFTDLTTGAEPAALVNGGIYSVDILGRVGYLFRVRLVGASSGSSVVTISGKRAVA